MTTKQKKKTNMNIKWKREIACIHRRTRNHHRLYCIFISHDIHKQNTCYDLATMRPPIFFLFCSNSKKCYVNCQADTFTQHFTWCMCAVVLVGLSFDPLFSIYLSERWPYSDRLLGGNDCFHRMISSLSVCTWSWMCLCVRNETVFFPHFKS